MRANSWLSHERYPIVLFALLVAFAGVLAIAPHDRADWALENALLFAAVAALVATRRSAAAVARLLHADLRLPLPALARRALHVLARCPYDAWFAALTGGSLSSAAGRNHYDRFVHFAYGLLLAYPIREVFLRVAEVRGFWGYYLPLDVTMATSMLYELIEWGAAVLFGGELGVAYLGSQGDPWDAQKDMALATLGAVPGDAGHGGAQLALPARLRPRVGGEPARQARASAGRGRAAPPHARRRLADVGTCSAASGSATAPCERRPSADDRDGHFDSFHVEEFSHGGTETRRTSSVISLRVSVPPCERVCHVRVTVRHPESPGA